MKNLNIGKIGQICQVELRYVTTLKIRTQNPSYSVDSNTDHWSQKLQPLGKFDLVFLMSYQLCGLFKTETYFWDSKNNSYFFCE